MSSGSVDHLDDDRVSALIDGKAPPADVEHAASCPECRDRLEAWSQIHGLLAAPPPAPSAEQRESAIATALAGVSAGEVASLDERRRRRARRLTGARAAAIVAVVALAAGIGVAADLAGGGGSGHVSTSSGPAARTEAPATVPSAGTAQSASGVAGGSAALGRLDSPAQLATTLRGRVGAAPGVAAAAPGALTVPLPAAACRHQAASAASAGGSTQPVFIGDLTYQGTPATVFVYSQGSRHIAVVVGNAGCGVLARVGF